LRCAAIDRSKRCKECARDSALSGTYQRQILTGPRSRHRDPLDIYTLQFSFTLALCPFQRPSVFLPELDWKKDRNKGLDSYLAPKPFLDFVMLFPWRKTLHVPGLPALEKLQDQTHDSAFFEIAPLRVGLDLVTSLAI
jgi:hypothetical protein